MLKQISSKFNAFFCLFFILASVFILRPFRDEMGVFYGTSKLQWLFTMTFLGVIPAAFLFRYFTSKYSFKYVFRGISVVYISILVLYYSWFSTKGLSSFSAGSFFIVTSIFNIYTTSLFWMLMVDFFSSEKSKKVFGFIMAGGSLGALFGSLLSSFLASHFSIYSFIIVAAFFLLISLFLFLEIIERNTSSRVQITFQFTLKSINLKKNKIGDNSKYLIAMVLFMLLYSSISTILYFQQILLVEDAILFDNDRLLYFSRVDFVTNGISILGQLFITRWFLKRYSITIALTLVPLLLVIGFTAINLKMTLLIASVLIVIHKVGNYVLIKPAREVLFTVCTKEEKYHIKNFIDTIIYRGGDAFTGWIFALILSLGIGLSFITLFTIPILVCWIIIGKKLGKYHLIKEHINHEN